MLPKMKDRKPSAAALEGSDRQAGYWQELQNATESIDRDDRLVFPGEGLILADDEDKGVVY